MYSLTEKLNRFTILYYAVVYTIWLKPRTPQNIVIGGGAGAFPPLIGWIAVTGEITIMPVLHAAVIYVIAYVLEEANRLADENAKFV